MDKSDYKNKIIAIVKQIEYEHVLRRIYLMLMVIIRE